MGDYRRVFISAAADFIFIIIAIFIVSNIVIIVVVIAINIVIIIIFVIFINIVISIVVVFVINVILIAVDTIVQDLGIRRRPASGLTKGKCAPHLCIAGEIYLLERLTYWIDLLIREIYFVHYLSGCGTQ